MRIPRFSLRQLLAVVAIAAYLVYIEARAPGFPRPRVWRLPDATLVRFFEERSNPLGRDTIKHLIIKPPGSPSIDYHFGLCEGGFQHVALFADPKFKIIWICDKDHHNSIICSLEFATGNFNIGSLKSNHPSEVGDFTGIEIE